MPTISSGGLWEDLYDAESRWVQRSSIISKVRWKRRGPMREDTFWCLQDASDSLVFRRIRGLMIWLCGSRSFRVAESDGFVVMQTVVWLFSKLEGVNNFKTKNSKMENYLLIWIERPTDFQAAESQKSESWLLQEHIWGGSTSQGAVYHWHPTGMGDPPRTRWMIN